MANNLRFLTLQNLHRLIRLAYSCFLWIPWRKLWSKLIAIWCRPPHFHQEGTISHGGCAEDRSKVSLHLQRLSDGNVTQLLQDVDGVEGLAWSRDGRRIVFSTANGGDLWEVALARPNHPVKLPIGHDASSIALVRLGLLSCKAEGV